MCNPNRPIKAKESTLRQRANRFSSLRGDIQMVWESAETDSSGDGAAESSDW